MAVLRLLIGRRLLERKKSLTDIDVVQLINIQRLRYLNHDVIRIKEDVLLRAVFDMGISERRLKGLLCLRCKDQIVESISSFGVSIWGRRAGRRGAWKKVFEVK